MRTIKIWKQKSGIEIDEIEFDGERRAFVLYIGDEHAITIYADSPEQSKDMRAGLDAGEDVRDWENGNGKCVGTLIEERTGNGLRKTLKRLENEGKCYNGQLSNSVHGTVWVDEVNGVNYEYESDDLDLGVDDLTNKDLKNIIIVE